MNAPRLASDSSVLVVDDEPLLRWALKETLGAKYPVYEAGSIREATVLAEQLGTRLGLVVLDLRLPDGQGLELVSRLKLANPRCHIVMLTAYADAAEFEYATAHGVQAILKKPIQMDDLMLYATRVLG